MVVIWEHDIARAGPVDVFCSSKIIPCLYADCHVERFTWEFKDPLLGVILADIITVPGAPEAGTFPKDDVKRVGVAPSSVL